VWRAARTGRRIVPSPGVGYRGDRSSRDTVPARCMRGCPSECVDPGTRTPTGRDRRRQADPEQRQPSYQHHLTVIEASHYVLACRDLVGTFLRAILSDTAGTGGSAVRSQAGSFGASERRVTRPFKIGSPGTMTGSARPKDDQGVGWTPPGCPHQELTTHCRNARARRQDHRRCWLPRYMSPEPL
jgi:hypothetical protein